MSCPYRRSYWTIMSSGLNSSLGIPPNIIYCMRKAGSVSLILSLICLSRRASGLTTPNYCSFWKMPDMSWISSEVRKWARCTSSAWRAFASKLNSGCESSYNLSSKNAISIKSWVDVNCWSSISSRRLSKTFSIKSEWSTWTLRASFVSLIFLPASLSAVASSLIA